MDETIEIRCLPVREDYIQTVQSRAMSWTRLTLMLIFGLGIAIVLSVLVLSIRMRDPFDLLVPICVPTVPGALAAFLFWGWLLEIRFRLGRQVDASPQMRSPTTLRISETYVEYQTEYVQSSVKWTVYSSVVEIEHYYLLFRTGNRTFFDFIPKRAFESREQEIGVRRILERQVGPIKDETRLKRVTLPALEALTVSGLFLLAVANWLVVAWRVMR